MIRHFVHVHRQRRVRHGDSRAMRFSGRKHVACPLKPERIHNNRLRGDAFRHSVLISFTRRQQLRIIKTRIVHRALRLKKRRQSGVHPFMSGIDSGCAAIPAEIVGDEDVESRDDDETEQNFAGKQAPTEKHEQLADC